MSADESVFSKSNAKSMFSSAQRSKENWNQDVVYDAQDVSAFQNDFVLANGDTIGNIEAGIYNYLRMPGTDRASMPSYPEKSELKRVAEKPEIYPFCTVPVEEFERALILKAIEDQFKSKEPDFEWNFFDRCIEEKYSKKGLVQEISECLLWEPDMITKYFARDDSLILGLYQRIPVDKSYTKQWKAQYKSLPDFNNWLDYFNKDNETPMPLYDIDDNKVGQLREFIQNLTPSNGGLMRIKKQNIGMDEYSIVECIKDGIIFGAQEGETSNFWVHYDRNTRLDFRQVAGLERYITKPVKEDLNESTPNIGGTPADIEAEKLRRQQIADEKARMEQERLAMIHEAYAEYRLRGSAATLAYNNGHLVTLLPNGYIMQSKCFIQRDLAQNPDSEYPEDAEESRIITPKSLIRYLVNGKIEIMHANGNFSAYDPTTELWTITNNSGKRRCKRQSDGFEYDIDSIPAAIETCAETDARVLFKEDNVISVLYPDGTRYTVHHDGTKILSNPDETEVVFEKIGYSIVKVLKGRMMEVPENVKNAKSSDSDIEFYESLTTAREYLRDRAKDETIMQTYLHDRSVVQSFIEVHEFGANQNEEQPDFDMEGEEIKQETPQDHKETEQQEDGPFLQAVHLIRRQDLSVTKVTSDGEMCLISGPTRSDLNKYGNLMKMGRDIDYLHEMFELRSQDRKGGIFTCSIDKSNISTHDKDKNYFAVNSNGTFEKVLAPEVSEVDQVEEHNDIDMEDEEDINYQVNQDQKSKGSKTNNGTSIPKVNISKSRSNLQN